MPFLLYSSNVKHSISIIPIIAFSFLILLNFMFFFIYPIMLNYNLKFSFSLVYKLWYGTWFILKDQLH